MSSQLGGWETKRHKLFPTVDVPLRDLPASSARVQSVFKATVFSFPANAYEIRKPHTFTLGDAFVVKYDAESADGQTDLGIHRDGSVITVNIALNEPWSYSGGGTWMQTLNKTVRLPQGSALIHCGKLTFRSAHHIWSQILARCIHRDSIAFHTASSESKSLFEKSDDEYVRALYRQPRTVPPPSVPRTPTSDDG